MQEDVVIDLTRALYLGLEHGSSSLRPWARLTTGRPAALEATHRAPLEQRLARLLELERALFSPSTLHVVTDLYAALAARVRRIHVDACAYPVTWWGLERARLRGVTITPYRSLSELGARVARGTGPLAIVTDAMCLCCRRTKPLDHLARLAQRSDGILIVDDSQGVGVLGANPTHARPYGHGGGGTLAWCAAPRSSVLLLGSLAKAFGAPLAFLAGNEELVGWFARESGTRVHASPCSKASLAALEHALDVNAERGDALRARLLERVLAFREAVVEAGGRLARGLFPVQATPAVGAPVALRLERELRGRGVLAVVTRAGRGQARVGCVLTATTPAEDARSAGRIWGEAWARTSALAA